MYSLLCVFHIDTSFIRLVWKPHPKVEKQEREQQINKPLEDEAVGSKPTGLDANLVLV